jgi:hypothetical protein
MRVLDFTDLALLKHELLEVHGRKNQSQANPNNKINLL